MLVVFDLDLTLWECGGAIWVDQTRPPYLDTGSGVFDAGGSKISLFPDVKSVLAGLWERGIPMAIASRTETPLNAEKLLNIFGISEYFSYKEIYPGKKIRHLINLSERSGTPFEEIVFFDDEYENIHDTLKMGVCAVEVRRGITEDLVARFVG